MILFDIFGFYFKFLFFSLMELVLLFSTFEDMVGV